MMQINLITNIIIRDDSQTIENANDDCLRTYAPFPSWLQKICL